GHRIHRRRRTGRSHAAINQDAQVYVGREYEAEGEEGGLTEKRPTYSFRNTTLAMTIANSAGSTGLATCIRKPAVSALNRSSERPNAVSAMAGICSDGAMPRSASSWRTLSSAV